MTEKISSRAKLFKEELFKSVKKLSLMYGYHCPQFNTLENDENLYLNLTLLCKNPEDQYAEWYEQYCENIGLKKEWLGESFLSKDKRKKLRILGLDIDGGEACVRVRDENNEDWHFDPESVIYLLSSHG